MGKIAEKKNLILYSIAFGLTMSGNQIFDFFVKWWLPRETGNGIVLGYTLGISTILGTIFSLLFGVISDKNNKKKLMIYSDFLSTFICLIGLIIYKFSYSPYIVAFTAIMLSVIKMMYSISGRGVFKNIFVKDEIALANRVQAIIKQTVKLVMPVVSNVLVLYYSVFFFFVINAMTFFISALLNIKLTYFSEKKVSNKNQKLSFDTFFEEMKQGLNAIKSSAVIVEALLLVSVANVFSGGYETLLPVVTKYSNTISYGVVLSGMAVGALIAPILISIKLGSFLTRSLWTPIVLAIISIIISSLSGVFIIIGAILYGLSTAIFDISFATELQINVDEDNIGKVFSVVFFLSGILMPIGQILFPIIFKNDIQDSFFYVGVAGGISLMVIYFFLRQKNKTEQK